MSPRYEFSTKGGFTINRFWPTTIPWYLISISLGRVEERIEYIRKVVVVARYRKLRSIHCEHAGIGASAVKKAGPFSQKFMHLIRVRNLAEIFFLAIIRPIELERRPADVHGSLGASLGFQKWKREYPPPHSWLRKAELCFLQFHYVKPLFVGHDRRVYTHADQEITRDNEGASFWAHPLEQFHDNLIHAL